MADRFEQFPPLLSDGVYRDSFDITPSDATVFSQPTRGLWIGTGGDIKVEFVGYDGSSRTQLFKGTPDGSLLRFRVQKVYATDTTANNIVGLF